MSNKPCHFGNDIFTTCSHGQVEGGICSLVVRQGDDMRVTVVAKSCGAHPIDGLVLGNLVDLLAETVGFRARLRMAIHIVGGGVEARTSRRKRLLFAAVGFAIGCVGVLLWRMS